MSNTVSPLPSGVGVTVIAEHRPHRDPDGHHTPDEDAAADEHPPAEETPARRGIHDAPPPVADQELVPAEMLFATALLANKLRTPPSPAAMQLTASHDWSPPESSLRLKDKLI